MLAMYAEILGHCGVAPLQWLFLPLCSFDCIKYLFNTLFFIHFVRNSYHFDIEVKDGKTTVKIARTDVFHIFEFSNK